MLGVISLLIGLIPFVGPLLASPRIKVTSIYGDRRGIIGPDRQPQGSVGFVHVRFKNHPLAPWLIRTTPATHLHALLRFFDLAGQPALRPIVGRWGDADQPASLSAFQSLFDLEQITLPPNGAPRELDIAAKSDGGTCYAFDNSSFQDPGLTRPEYKLPDLPLLVVAIDLRADNFGPYRQWFQLDTSIFQLKATRPPNWHRRAATKED